MPEATDKVRAHYSPDNLTQRIQSALAAIAPEDQPLTAAQLAPLDQFHTRGILATAELAGATRLSSADRVLDIGCGIGGPARYLAANFGCPVTGIDLSPSFIDAANYLTARCQLSSQITFQAADALHLPFADASFSIVFLQHVAMNIHDRARLYAEAHRVLAPGGKFVAYDVILCNEPVSYPVPWARDASTSFLLTEQDTRKALELAGFKPTLWRDDTQVAVDWFAATFTGAPPAALSLGTIMGPEFPAIAANLGRNLREGHLGVLSAILTRN